MLNFLIIDNLIKDSLREDMPFGDITTVSTVASDSTCTASLYAKETGIICGIDVFKRVFTILGNVTVDFTVTDGNTISNGQRIAILKGNTRNILMGERIALNLLQRMSGIASTTRKYVDAISNTNCNVVDTRKTTPLYRHIDKYAVLCGGGANHRFSLSDSILIKDNHIDAAGGIEKAVNLAKSHASFTTKIEVETETENDVIEALNAKADIIMLDNMSPEMTSKMVNLINKKAIIECSGNITLETIGDYAKTGVDYISVGALTHSFKVLDISLKHIILD